MKIIIFLLLLLPLIGASQVQKSTKPHSFEIEHAKFRVKTDSIWSKWVNSYDKRNNVYINYDSSLIILSLDDTKMRFKIMLTNMPNNGNDKNILWTCSLENGNNILCGIEWSYKAAPNTISLYDKNLQICFYLKK